VPEKICYTHAHFPSSMTANQLFEIADTHKVTVVCRREDGGNLANGLEFLWCDGSGSTIAAMLIRGYQNTIDLSSTLKDERDQMLGENKLENHIKACEKAAEGWSASSYREPTG
jgi:hypothetical protein